MGIGDTCEIPGRKLCDGGRVGARRGQYPDRDLEFIFYSCFTPSQPPPSKIGLKKRRRGKDMQAGPTKIYDKKGIKIKHR